MSRSDRGAEELAGRTIVVVGASSGFGRGAALELGRLGAAVVVAARRGDALADVVAEIERDGGRALAVATDVSDAASVEALADAAVARFGGIDVWVNNVGIGTLGFLWEVPVRDLARVVDVNLKGLVHGAHAALRRFVEQGHGTLVNVGSVESTVPLAYQAVYAATKAGVLSLGRSLNEELRLAGLADRIAVGTVMPWAVDTPWWTHAANYTGRTPRMAELDDPRVVVEAIVSACGHPVEAQKVGWKARIATFAEGLLPGTTDRVSADIIHSESLLGREAPHTSGAIHEPMAHSDKVDGGVRERMREEDAERARLRARHPESGT